MANEEKKPVRQMPKGGRKGGTSFPRHTLQESLAWAKKLVSKTHSGPQPKDVIYSGVVGAKSGNGDVKISALRQYGLLEGTSAGFLASSLAKKIDASPPEEVQSLHRQAMLHATVFKALFDTFHGDAVTKAKLKQRAADLKVHPDETERCVEAYVSGMSTAGLVTVEGDTVSHLPSTSVAEQAPDSSEGAADVTPPDESFSEPEEATDKQGTDFEGAPGRSPRAMFNVNVNLDSSLDIEKLARQLELLKRFGAI